MASQINSQVVVCSTVYSDAGQRKHQSSASLAFVRGIHRDRWIPRTKGQLHGKCFQLMTASWFSSQDKGTHTRCQETHSIEILFRWGFFHLFLHISEMSLPERQPILPGRWSMRYITRKLISIGDQQSHRYAQDLLLSKTIPTRFHQSQWPQEEISSRRYLVVLLTDGTG